MRRRIGDFAIEVMREEQMRYIGYNEFGALDEVYSRALAAGVTKPIAEGRVWKSGMSDNPIHRQTIVLNALARDERFRMFYIRCCSRSSDREHRVREFEVK